MQILRRLSLAVLWGLAAVGVGCALVWGATTAGFIKPLIVISGSMEPQIMTGDLLIATPVQTSTLEVGDVVSLPSDLTENLVTHRIEAIQPEGNGGYRISMKGDNNAASDALDYFVGETVWQPAMQFGAWGTVVQRLSTPPVAIPLVLGLVGLLGLSLLAPPPARAPRRDAGADESSRETMTVAS